MRKWRSLRGPKAFHQLRLRGQKIQGELIQVWYRAEPSDQVQVVVGFAVARGEFSAVRRNRIKRLMREAFRLEFVALKRAAARQQVDIWVLLFCKPRNSESVTTLRLDNVQRDLSRACKSIASTL